MAFSGSRVADLARQQAGRLRQSTVNLKPWPQHFAGASLLAAAMAGAASAAQPAPFDIREAYAPAAVLQFAEQSGLQVFAPSTLLRGVRVNAVEGVYDPVDALAVMLEGTGLEAVPATGGAIVIRQIAQPGETPPPAAGATGEPSSPAREPPPAAPPPPERIVITGSRLLRHGSAIVQPSYTTSRSELGEQGVFNAADALESLPGFGVSGSSAVGVQSTFGVGQRFVNFFGLGSQRTLTLVNGRRFVSSGTASSVGAASPGQQVDFNLLPLALIERIETVAIGGAPAYGADAVAGTVNIILRNDFEGAAVEARHSQSGHGGLSRHAVRGLWGRAFEQGRSHIVASFEYDANSGMLERDHRRFARRPFLVRSGEDPGWIILEDMVLSGITDGGLPLPPGDTPAGWQTASFPSGFFIFNRAGEPVQFLPDGTLGRYQLGGGGGAQPVFVDGGDGLRIPDYMTLVAPGQRLLASVLARQELTASVSGFVELAAARSEGEEPRELLAINSVLLPEQGGPLRMHIDNPFLHPQAREIIVANGLTEFHLSRNLSDLLDHMPGETRITLGRAVAGLEGHSAWRGHPVRWEVSTNYGRTNNVSRIPVIKEDNFHAAIQAVADPVSGNIVCASPAPPGCVPLNLFGEGRASAEALRFVTGAGYANSINEQAALVANISGELGGPPAGPLGYSFGMEHRRERAAFNPDTHLAEGSPRLPAYSPIRGSFSTSEAFGELLVPLVSSHQNLPLLAEASLEGAVRLMSSSIAGNDMAWTLGGQLRPRLYGSTTPLSLRAVITRSVRAPSITELFLPESPMRGTATDPCDRSNFAAGPNPAIRSANCRLALEQLGAPPPENFSSDIMSFGVTGRIAGNPDLRNERADSWSAGMAWKGEQVRVSADWVNIRLADGIASLTASQLMAACYDSPHFPDEPACTTFTRASGPNAGQIADYQTGYFNVSRLEYSALIVGARMQLDAPEVTGAQTVIFSLDALQVGRYRLQSTSFAAPADLAGTVGTPDTKLSAGVMMQWPRAQAGIRAQWISAGRLNNAAENRDVPGNDVASYVIVHGSLNVDLTSTVRIQFNVDNLFDAPPPYATLLAASPSARRAYDVVGRRFSLGLTAAF